MPGRTNTELQDADSASTPTPIHIEAEDYIRQSGGITTETCTDTGGGQNLTGINNTSWAEYSVNVPVAGTYLVKFRVAGSAGTFQFKDSSLNVLATVNVPNTGGMQTWTTVTATVVLPAGTQKLHFYVTWYGWNINWFELVLRGANGASSESGVGGYRYGFNGKENDNEMKGLGTQQDYGMRIYDPRLGRFLSVDPISKNYPQLTPYQFASNRPIDGVDFDGLEYVKRIHTVNAAGQVVWTDDVIYYQMNEKTLLAHGGTTKGRYNSAGYGPEGKGIKHEYYMENGEEYRKPIWNLPGSYATHGLYSGDGCITYTGAKDYDFSWKPIDEVDAIAKRHDLNYTRIGVFDIVEDSRTLSADLQMVDEATKYLNSIPFKLLTGKRVAGETVIAAYSQQKLMNILSDYKQWKIKYMIKVGLDPTNRSDLKKISLDKLKYKLAYINSDKDGRARRTANLAVLLAVKSKTN